MSTDKKKISNFLFMIKYLLNFYWQGSNDSIHVLIISTPSV